MFDLIPLEVLKHILSFIVSDPSNEEFLDFRKYKVHAYTQLNKAKILYQLNSTDRNKYNRG